MEDTRMEDGGWRKEEMRGSPPGLETLEHHT